MPGQIPVQPLPHIDVVGVVEARRHDTRDRVRLAVEAELTAHNRPVGAVTRAPESIADHRDRLVGDEERTADGKSLSELRAHTEQIEQVAADANRVDAKRVEAGIREVDAETPPGS